MLASTGVEMNLFNDDLSNLIPVMCQSTLHWLGLHDRKLLAWHVHNDKKSFDIEIIFIIYSV